MGEIYRSRRFGKSWTKTEVTNSFIVDLLYIFQGHTHLWVNQVDLSGIESASSAM